MLDLEKSITSWRKQMLAAGIQSPVPLEELESHLRDDIELQLKSGTDQQRAFELAMIRTGKADALRIEFKKTAGWLGWLGEHRYRILGGLWLAFCLASIVRLTATLAPVFYGAPLEVAENSFEASLLGTLYTTGAIYSIFLLAGNLRGLWFVRLLAFSDAAIGTAAMILGHFALLTCIFTVFGYISIWFLRPPRGTNSVAT